MKKRQSLLLLTAALFLTGCGPKGCGYDNSSGLSAADLPAPTYGQATLAGRVTFEGEIPQMPVIDAAQHCGGEIRREYVVVGPDRGLANVLVSLDGVPASNGYARPAAELDQINCQFVPHVLAVQVGQKLDLHNGDPEIHTVHYAPQNNPADNVSLPTPGQTVTVAFDRSEPRPLGVDCGNHAWMQAYLGVFPHPFFATTDKSGRFEIGRVPAGTYTVRAWHESLGQQSKRQVVVPAAGDVAADFVFARAG